MNSGDDISRFETELEQALQRRLRREDPRSVDPPWAPDEDQLLQLATDPGALDPSLRRRIETYLQDHPGQRDAIEAIREDAAMRRPAERAGLLARLAELLSGLLAVPGLRSALPAALGVLLLGGVYLATVDPFGRRIPLTRDGGGTQQPGPDLGASLQITLLPGEPAELKLGGETEIDLNLLLPPTADPRTVAVEVRRDGHPLALPFPGPAGGSTLRLAEPPLEGRYEVRATPRDGTPTEYVLEIR